MPNDKVLVISDSQPMADFWSYILNQIKILSLSMAPDQDILEAFFEQAFDLVVLDYYTADMEPLLHIKSLRTEIAVPLLLLVSNQSEAYILEAYKVGIDECIVKPISPRLFQAKTQSWLNRSWTVPAAILDTFRIGDVELNPTRREFINSVGASIKLTNLEFRLLHLLMSHPGQPLEADLVINRVWGYYGDGNSTLLKNIVYRLRRKIEPDPRNPCYILSLSGEGYLFQPQ